MVTTLVNRCRYGLTGTEFRVKNGSATPLTINYGSGNTVI